MALRVAEPRRRAIFTKKSNVDSEAPGRPQMRKMSDIVEYLEKDRTNAVLLQRGPGWVAVFLDVSTSKWAVCDLPVSDPANLLAKKLPDAEAAVSAALQLS